MKKGSKLYSIFRKKCPVCHEGDFFVERNPYRLRRLGEVHQKCKSCDTKLIKEPGFFFGAMYVSYALGVAVFVAIWIGMSVLYPAYEPFDLAVVLISVMVLISPYLHQLSRIIWGNMFFHYRGKDEPSVDGKSTPAAS